jgi:hypothetical protein
MKVEKKTSLKGISNLTRNNSVGVSGKKTTEPEKDALKTNSESNAVKNEDQQGGVEVLKTDIFEVKLKIKLKSIYLVFDFDTYVYL